jgi:oligosaccharide repeat unit polymerase
VSYVLPPFFAVVCLGLFVVVWKKDSRNSIIFTPFLILMANEISRVMPAFIVTAISGEVPDFYPLMVFFLSFVSVITGFAFAIEYVRFESYLPRRFLCTETRIRSERQVLFAILCASVGLFAAGLYLYQGFPSVTQALIGMVTGEEAGELLQTVGEARRTITKGYYFGEAYRGQGLIRALMQTCWPFLCCMALAVFIKTKKISWLLVLVALVFASFVFIAGDGTRAPFINMLILLIVLYSFLKRITKKSVLMMGLCLTVVAILLSLYSYKAKALLGSDDFVLTALSKIWERILVGNGLNDIWAIEFIRSSVLEYRLGGVHLRDFLAALPGTQGGVPFAHELYLLMNPGAIGTTYATGTYITKAFVDFGIAGVGFLFFGIGFLIGICQVAILQVKKTLLNLTLVTFVAFYTGNMVLNGPIGALSALVVVGAFYAFMRGLFLLSEVLMMGRARNRGFPLGAEAP